MEHSNETGNDPAAAIARFTRMTREAPSHCRAFASQTTKASLPGRGAGGRDALFFAALQRLAKERPLVLVEMLAKLKIPIPDQMPETANADLGPGDGVEGEKEEKSW